jgi:hypothetical protein
MRYFRSTLQTYLGICAELDAAYGYPNPETKTDRALPLADDLPADAEGRVYLMVSADYCEYILPGQILPELIASGAVEEVAADVYESLLPVV